MCNHFSHASIVPLLPLPLNCYHKLHMNAVDLEALIATHKPVFKRILDTHGAKDLLQYYRSHRHTPSGLPPERVDELIVAAAEMTARLIGTEASNNLREQLRKAYVVSTAAHHDPATHPFFANSIIAAANAAREDGLPAVIVFSCGGISMNNSSFPRGLILHDERGREERLYLASLKNHQHPAYGRPGYTPQEYERMLERIDDLVINENRKSLLRDVLKDTYGAPETLRLPLYSEQITRGLHSFWKRVPGMNKTDVIYLEQETLAHELLIRHHLANPTIIHKLIFDAALRSEWIQNLDGIIGGHDSKADTGTHLFWGLTEKERIPLRIVNGALTSKEHGISIPLEPSAIAAALAEKKLLSSMALTLSLFSFYYGLPCAGGFSQVGYLEQMKRAYMQTLKNTPYTNETDHLKSVPTDFFAGEFILALLGYGGMRIPATPVDLILYGNRTTGATLHTITRTTSLRTAVTPMLPELYKIITGTRPPITLEPHHTPTITMRTCYYCGNNPIPHLVARINEYITLFNKPLLWLGQSSLGRFVERLLDWVAVPLCRIGALLRVVVYSTDISKAATSRSQVIWEEAERRGIQMRQLVIFGRKTDLYEARLADGRVIVFESIPIPSRLRTGALDWMDDKLELKKRLQQASIPVARGGAFTRFAPMVSLFKTLTPPVIVKPALGSRGRHTTTTIYTEEQLRTAFDIGKQISRRLVVEEHLVGSVYRATIVAGVLYGVLRGDPPRITGDGIKDIRALIVEKNKTKPPQVKEYSIGPLTDSFLARSGYVLDTVLPAGTTIDLTEKIGLSYGGFSAEDFTRTHPETKKILEAAGRLVNFPVIGFDFIIPDITKEPRGQKWGIIEANSLPFIDLHHRPAEGEPINVAAAVWDLWNIQKD